MNQSTTKPGRGALFHRKNALDLKTKAQIKAGIGPRVAIYSGEIVLPGGERLQVLATYHERTKQFECEVREFDTWTSRSTFTLPDLAGENYRDTVMPIGTRKYKLRAIRAEKIDSDTGEIFKYIRLEMPQVNSGDQPGM